jgi:hypothetical protein
MDCAKLIISSLMKSLLYYIQQNNNIQAFATAESLSYIFLQKDNRTSFASIAFQEGEEATTVVVPSLFDILDALVPININSPVVDDDIMYKLQLPPSSDDRVREYETLSRATKIVQYLCVAYNNSTVTNQHLERLVQYVESSLPPLSEYDFNRTFIVLPLLSSALRNNKNHNTGQEEVSIKTRQLLQSMTIDLADIAMNSSNDIAREHAAHCTYATIAYYTVNNRSLECYSAKVAKEIVLSSLQYNIRTIQNEQQSSLSSGKQKGGQDNEKIIIIIQKVIDSLSMLSLLGSAAAIRGGTSNSIVDEIIRFFLNLSNNKVASYPFMMNSSEQTTLDLHVLDTTTTNTVLNSTYLSAKAGSLFGMLLTCTGQVPLRKQRLCHIAMKHIKDMKLKSDIPLLPLGIRIAIARIICCIDIRSISAQDLMIIVEILLTSLRTDALEESTTLNIKSLKLTLTSVIKILHLSPTTLYTKLYVVVTGVMRAFAYTKEIECKLLSLQILGTVAKLDTVSDVLKKLKAPVTSILAVSMNQSSVLLRQAAVKVRNDWFLVE